MKFFKTCIIPLLLVPPLSSPTFSQQPQKLDSFALDRDRSMLRQAYEDVRKNYYDPAYRGVDLDASYRQFDAAMGNATSNSEAFRMIAGFLFTLHDSHTFFMPPSRVNHADRGFHIELIGNKCFVTRMRPGSDASKKLHPGDQLLTLDGFGVNRESFHTMEYIFQVLSRLPEHQLVLLSPSGQQRKETVQAVIRPGKAVLNMTGRGNDSDFWDLVRADEEEAHLDRERILATSDVFIWKMPAFYISQETINTIFSKVRDHKTLILDLRGNHGGSVDTLKNVLSHLFDHDVKMGDRVSRKETKPEMIKASKIPFTGKLIVLVDSESASSSEILARVVQLEHRGTVLGDRTAGAVMEARHYDESLGSDTKVFYGFSITSANLLMTDGKSLEDVGVTPDEIVVATADDLAFGRDPLLSRAADLAGAKMDPVAAGKAFPFEWPSN
jgi:carboxyl-terminal processing protease